MAYISKCKLNEIVFTVGKRKSSFTDSFYGNDCVKTQYPRVLCCPEVTRRRFFTDC